MISKVTLVGNWPPLRHLRRSILPDRRLPVTCYILRWLQVPSALQVTAPPHQVISEDRDDQEIQEQGWQTLLRENLRLRYSITLYGSSTTL